MADSLIKEVNEALRADRAAGLWHKYKRIIILCAFALLLGTAAHSGWQHYRHVHGGKTLLQFSEGQKQFDAKQFGEAALSFAAIAQDNRGELRELALVWRARALVAADKTSEAIQALTAASTGKSLWADIACLRLAGLDEKAATCLALEHQSPLADERAQWAAANAWATGDPTAAITTLDRLIADEHTSEDTRTQLMQWQAVMKAEKK